MGSFAGVSVPKTSSFGGIFLEWQAASLEHFRHKTIFCIFHISYSPSILELINSLKLVNCFNSDWATFGPFFTRRWRHFVYAIRQLSASAVSAECKQPRWRTALVALFCRVDRRQTVLRTETTQWTCGSRSRRNSSTTTKSRRWSRNWRTDWREFFAAQSALMCPASGCTRPVCTPCLRKKNFLKRCQLIFLLCVSNIYRFQRKSVGMPENKPLTKTVHKMSISPEVCVCINQSSIHQSNYFIARPKVDQRAGQLSLPHVA